MNDVMAYLWWAFAWACALALAACGMVQLGRAAKWEVSARSMIGLGMVAAAGVLAESLRIAPPSGPLMVLALLVTCGSAWLVWTPHTHPVLERVTTGFGLLDGAKE